MDAVNLNIERELLEERVCWKSPRSRLNSQIVIGIWRQDPWWMENRRATFARTRMEPAVISVLAIHKLLCFSWPTMVVLVHASTFSGKWWIMPKHGRSPKAWLERMKFMELKSTVWLFNQISLLVQKRLWELKLLEEPWFRPGLLFWRCLYLASRTVLPITWATVRAEEEFFWIKMLRSPGRELCWTMAAIHIHPKKV